MVWVQQCLTGFRAESLMGFEITSEELASLYRYWWYVAHLLGLEGRFVEGISSNAEAARVDALLQAVTGTASPESFELAMATIRAVAGALRATAYVPERLGRQALYALARRFQRPMRAAGC
ncbi:hypothetical protein ABZ863_19535 [Saccharomonospora sp. NPDC046836]|uniref:hypothetical protein n=1 Tax=Saccharomonospora sp. NPDC046836 TaxID=3156921 RepID=UPI0033F765DA